MSKHALSFIELHNPLFMQGTNLGNKINAAQRGAGLYQDDERGVVWVHYKGKTTAVPLASVASSDFLETPEDVKALFTPNEETEYSAPPAIARSRRAAIPQPAVVPDPYFDPNDTGSAEAHRAAVRAASANANRPQGLVSQNDTLIQQARSAAAGIKTHAAQVSNPTQPKEGARVTGKKKAISHTELKTQVAAEAKE